MKHSVFALVLNRLGIFIVLLLFTVIVGLGCAQNPCAELADKTCKKLGEESATCLVKRQESDNPDVAKQAQCRRALVLYNSLESQKE